MKPFNLSFQLFLVDPRPIADLRAGLDEMFGGQFEQDLEYRANGVELYTNYVFGLTISCRQEVLWPEGNVYRFLGSNDVSCRFIDADNVDIAFHARQLLSNLNLARILTLSEYRDEAASRQQG